MEPWQEQSGGPAALKREMGHWVREVVAETARRGPVPEGFAEAFLEWYAERWDQYARAREDRSWEWWEFNWPAIKRDVGAASAGAVLALRRQQEAKQRAAAPTFATVEEWLAAEIRGEVGEGIPERPAMELLGGEYSNRSRDLERAVRRIRSRRECGECQQPFSSSTPYRRCPACRKARPGRGGRHAKPRGKKPRGEDGGASA